MRKINIYRMQYAVSKHFSFTLVVPNVIWDKGITLNACSLNELTPIIGLCKELTMTDLMIIEKVVLS